MFSYISTFFKTDNYFAPRRWILRILQNVAEISRSSRLVLVEIEFRTEATRFVGIAEIAKICRKPVFLAAVFSKF